MSRISKAAKGEAFKLWLGGYSYREIRDKTKMSLGAINELTADIRGKVPDLDQLRELNLVLSRGGSTVFDAMRGGMLLSELNRLGVGIDTLEGFVKLSVRIASEKGIEAERFAESSMKLMDLEAKTGKNYAHVLKDFEERAKQIEGLEVKAKGVQGEIQRLMKSKAQLEGEIREAKERLNSTLQELNRIITNQDRLQKLDLEKVFNLAQFIEDFELLGFHANAVRELANWKKSLAEMGIDSNKLGDFIKEKGPLETQISRMRNEAKAEGRKVEALRAEVKRLWNIRTSIEVEVSKLSKLSIILEKRKAMIPCKLCGREGVLMEVPNRLVAWNAMANGLVWKARCPYCGQSSQYSPWDILTNVGWLALPEP